LRDKLEALVQMLWDLGLEIGHSIRTIDECLSESAADITVQTSLLEARYVTGNQSLLDEMRERFTRNMDARRFFQDKVLELRQRHVKYENTPYSLEPNCKESPGGLRDLQVILWIAKAAGLGESWNQLADSHMITPTEARQLAAQGVQELVLISQITTNYGLDLYGRPQLAELLRALGEVEIPWIRVHYAYPSGLTSEVLAAYREVPNVLPYLDLPLQHSHPDVLRAMNRPWQAGVTGGLLQRIRQELPDAVLRTTFIVGFPGETEEHFEHLLDFVAEQRFDHVGVFTFSPEEGTPAAELADPVPPNVASARKDRLMALQQPIAAARNAAWVGRIVDVLIEQENPSTGEMLGRCARFAPEVDGEVRVMPGEGGLCAAPGTLVPVRITTADTYDLIGEVVGVKAMVGDALAARPPAL
jgi:hypothetical protein